MLDVDGVVAPLHGPTPWGDDAGNMFGPVTVSPSLCAALDQLNTTPGVHCAWLTSWTARMRAKLDQFPGRDWGTIADPEDPQASSLKPSLLFAGTSRWKWDALDRFLEVTP